MTEERPNFNVFLDPKCDWAVRHLEHFPVEIMRAHYETLLRVPGIGVKSAQADFDGKANGKPGFSGSEASRCGAEEGSLFYPLRRKNRCLPLELEENRITTGLISDSRKKNWELEHRESFRQMNLFDDCYASDGLPSF